MGNLIAVILIALSFVLPLASRTLRRLRPAEFLTVWLALVLHHAVSLYNVYVGEVFGAGTDARIFFEKASYAAQHTQNISFGVGARFYEWYLAEIFRFLGPSLLLAQTLVVLAFFVALIYLLKLKTLLRFKHGGVAIVALFGFEPAMLLWASINLREAYQILFLILVLYFGIRGKITRQRGDLFKAGVALVPLGFLHNGLAAYVPFLFVALLWWDFSDQSTKIGTISRKTIKRRVMAVVGILCLVVLVLNLPGQGALKAVQSGQALEYATTYRAGSAANTGGSDYGKPLNISSPTAILSTGFAATAHYFFGPFVWEVRGSADIVALLSTFIRIILLLFAVKEWRSSKGTSRGVSGFLLFVFLSLEFLWSTGTTNYGTAMRHHMVGYGVLVLLGSPRFSRFVVKLLPTVQPRAEKMVIASSVGIPRW